MNWISGLQSAIDYIEDHLTEELDYVEIAKRAYSSSFHFQRVFGILCGYTLGEYIRNRRLTRAAADLLLSDAKVIDVALQYGYDSPESFSRAFARFHGVTPSQAKRDRTALKSFSRLSVKLILAGGNVMDYRIEKTDAIEIVMKKERFTGGSEVSKMQIPALWARSCEDGTIPMLCRHLDPGSPLGEALVGVSLSDPEEGDFDYGIGVASKSGQIEDGLSRVSLPAATWIVFPCRGKIPDAFFTLIKRIYSEFFPTSEYQPNGMCLEVYPGEKINMEDYYGEFWISVEKRG